MPKKAFIIDYFKYKFIKIINCIIKTHVFDMFDIRRGLHGHRCRPQKFIKF